jgi:hypothetical protein
MYTSKQHGETLAELLSDKINEVSAILPRYPAEMVKWSGVVANAVGTLHGYTHSPKGAQKPTNLELARHLWRVNDCLRQLPNDKSHD